ncbi:MAG: EAL domain-containing protein [Gammaproteobacteria bacterium]
MKKEYQILLVDDDLDFADHFRSLVDKHPSHTFKFERVSVLTKANKSLRENKYDAVLLNFSLKQLDSPDRILELEIDGRDIPVIGLTDLDEQNKANEAIEFGLQDQIIKTETNTNYIVSKILFAIKRMDATTSRNREISAIELLYQPKTGLPNETLFKDRYEQALNRADRSQVAIGLLAIHLKDFYPVKDRLGSRIGDEVLSKATKLFNQTLRKGDTVAQIEDDKFMVILENLEKNSEVALLAERIVRAFSRRFIIDEHTFKMTASVGIAIYPECNGYHESIKSANVAMKRAADAGGNRYKLYTENLTSEAIWKYNLENDLEKALQEQQFELHYQPVIGVKEGRIIGMEALLRWFHPEQGPMLPGAFIDELESSDMILEVGEWVLDEACRKIKLWQSKYVSLVMAVNLSARQLQDPYLMERVNVVLERHDIDPKQIELEITERQLVDKNDAITQYNIQALVDRGITLALDDFGTGYSSEFYFQYFPANTINTLKIDRSDINGMMDNGEVADRVKKYIEFAKAKNLRIVAEGIETTAQLERVEQLGIDVMQGFLFSKPITGSQIEDGLRRNEFTLDKYRAPEALVESS